MAAAAAPNLAGAWRRATEIVTESRFMLRLAIPNIQADAPHSGLQGRPGHGRCALQEHDAPTLWTSR